MEMGIAKGARRWYNNKQVAEGKTATMFCARGVSVMARKEISKAMLKRLPVYLSYLKSLPDSGHTHISATALASALSMGEVQVRKDLATVSSGGRPKVGYVRQDLILELEEGVVLIDYKTDRVSRPEELVQRYRTQLACYKLAVEEYLGRPVTGSYLYSFGLGQLVEVK